MKQIMKGSYPIEVIAAQQREFEGQIKLINAVVSTYAIMSKNKRAEYALERMNLIDGTTAIDLMLGDPEVDKVKCPEQKELITRQECLDYSGESKHYIECAGCEIGKATKRKLSGE